MSKKENYTPEQLADNSLIQAKINLLQEKIRPILANTVALEAVKTKADTDYQKSRKEYLEVFKQIVELQATLINIAE